MIKCGRLKCKSKTLKIGGKSWVHLVIPGLTSLFQGGMLETEGKCH